jgi:hypothetical protein
VIGRLELFGSHCFPRSCLHWGLIEGETYLDPLTLVGAGPVRLLPLSVRLSAAPSSTPTLTGFVTPTPGPAYGHAAAFRTEVRLGGAPAGRPHAAVRW